jgi:phosphatidylserine/phosphatidylglycerophosphate/cardiolipin synthase-like enzyme
VFLSYNPFIDITFQANQTIPALVKTLLSFLVIILLTCSCSPVTGTVIATSSAPANWYSVYFTNPMDPSNTSYHGGIDESLAAAIDQARISIDMAIYDLNLWSVRDALISAHRRGVQVRVVSDSDNMDEQEIQELIEAGIQVLGDRRESLMHDKFVIIDRLEVWTGSMNFTTGGAYLDNNNLIRIRSSQLADDYTIEFEQMFTDDRFGTRKTPSTPHPTFSLNGSLIEAYFSPEDGTLAHILSTVNAATESIYFLAYSFTSDDLRQALISCAQSGITVAGVFDHDQYLFNTGTEYENLLNAGVDVHLDGNPRLMHHKVIIIDGQVVITGSYNFSNNAEHNNDENTLIIHNQDIAALYLAEFQQVYQNAQR